MKLQLRRARPLTASVKSEWLILEPPGGMQLASLFSATTANCFKLQADSACMVSATERLVHSQSTWYKYRRVIATRRHRVSFFSYIHVHTQ